MNTLNFAEICWGDYELDGRIVPYNNNEDDENYEIDELVDWMLKDW